jgi:hypothetical protein
MFTTIASPPVGVGHTCERIGEANAPILKAIHPGINLPYGFH